MATRYEHWDTSNATTAGGYPYAGQTFTPSIPHTVRMVKLGCYPNNGTHVVEIFATSGGLPTGSPLVSGLMSAINHQPYEYVGLGAGAALTAGVLYAIRTHTGWVAGHNMTYAIKNRDPRYPDGAFFWSYVTTSDLMFEEWDASFAYPPVLTSPSNGATNVSLTPTFQATYEHCESTAQAGAQWQIDEYGDDFSSPVWDSGDDAVNLLSITLSEVDRLNPNTQYIWRVRHKDSAGEWSEWPTAWSFTTKGKAYSQAHFIG